MNFLGKLAKEEQLCLFDKLAPWPIYSDIYLIWNGQLVQVKSTAAIFIRRD